MLNGEVFITRIRSTRSNPTSPRCLPLCFNQVDVIKSPLHSQTETGISVSLNLHTYRPWDLPHGFTYSYFSADGEEAALPKKLEPEAKRPHLIQRRRSLGSAGSGDFSDTTRRARRRA